MKKIKNMNVITKKIIAGELYLPTDPVLVTDREYTRRHIRQYNQTTELESSKRTELLKKFFGSTGDNLYIEPIFRCDYGYNIHVGENFHANIECIILDVCEVRIGDNCMLAPGVHIYTATLAYCIRTFARFIRRTFSLF
jgi:maltose O-acetyltransferase